MPLDSNEAPWTKQIINLSIPLQYEKLTYRHHSNSKGDKKSEQKQGHQEIQIFIK